MTKAELVEKICTKAGLSAKSEAEAVLNAVLAELGSALASGSSVTFTGFGTFKVTQRAARRGRNPRTHEEMDIPACNVVKFIPGKALKDSLK